MEDNASVVSCGSVISLESVEEHYEGKPKCDRKFKGHSPYLPRSSRGIAVKSGQKRNTGHAAWSAAIRNGFPGISSENSSSNCMSSSQIQQKSKSRNSHYSRGSFSRDERIVLASGKPAYKSQEDYYDEVLELRQVIKTLKTDNGVLEAKLQRVMQENVLKDRQIKDFLNQNKQPEELRRTLTDRNADSSTVVLSLKQKLHLMECNVKEKENELRKLKSDVKSTNVEELRVQMETYYEEAQRLQNVLSSVYSQVPGSRNFPGNRMNTARREGLTKVNGDQFEQVLDEKRRLESENETLKKDLLCAISGQRDGSKNVDYADMSRPHLLLKISELEKLLANASVESQKRIEVLSTREHSSSAENEIRKQRGVIEKLKEDRTHYREEADELRSKLEEAEEEIAYLKERMRRVNEEQKRIEKEDQASMSPQPVPRRRIKTGSLEKKLSVHGIEEKGHEDLVSSMEDKAARVLQRNWKRYMENASSDLSFAVLQIQAAFRAHAIRRRRIRLLSNAEKVEEDDLELGDATTRIQGAMRAHHVRRRYYSNAEKQRKRESSSEHSDDENHEKNGKMFEQQSFLHKACDSEPVGNSLNIESESDDDVVIGGSHFNLKSDKLSPSREQAPVRNEKYSHEAQPFPSFRNDEPGIQSEGGEDNVEVSTGNSTREKQANEQRLQHFFDTEDKEIDVSNDRASSLDNFFSSLRSTKAQFDAGSDPESEGPARKTSRYLAEQKPEKSLFSWSRGKQDTSKNAPVPAPRKYITSANFWSSQPSEDSEDDVVVTPKISRKNPTKTASLLDELF